MGLRIEWALAAQRDAGRVSRTMAGLLALASLSGCMTLLHSDEELRERAVSRTEEVASSGNPAGPQQVPQAVRVPVFSAGDNNPSETMAGSAADAGGLVPDEFALSGQAWSVAYAQSELKGRKLLEAAVDRAFAALERDGSFPKQLGTHPRPLPAEAGAAAEGVLHAANTLAFKEALAMEPVLREAADEVPMKFGREKYKGQMPVSQFLHRTLGSATYHDLELRLVRALAKADDPRLRQYVAGLDRGRRVAFASDLARQADLALWTVLTRSEIALVREGA